MIFSPVPDKKFKRLTDITPEFLDKNGIKLLLLDLDNTISPYTTDEPTEDVLAWTERMKDSGIRLFIVSNNKGDRPEVFSKSLTIPYIKLAKKPSPKGVLLAMETEGAAKENTALVGDQVYTDMLAANLAGVMGILVEPIKFSNPFLAIRYFFELPFRHEKRKGSNEK